MKIDTTYTAGKMVTTLTLINEETELTDDLLARIGCNQHRLVWQAGADGVVELGEEDPATFRLPVEYRDWSVRRRSADGVTTVSVTYRMGGA